MFCRLTIRAIPNAPRTMIAGWLGEALKVKVHAPASASLANEELCDFLAKKLGVPRRSVSLLSGKKSRHKVIQIEGLLLPDLKARLPTS